MIYILERYITKTTALATAIISLVITGILFLMTMLSELKNIGEGDYGFIQVLYYVILRLPTEVYHFFPMLILLGSIVGLSVLSSSRELAVMRTAGFPIFRILLSVLTAAFLLTFIVTGVSEIIAPNLSYKAEVHKENARNAGVAVVTATGVWFHVDNNFVHIQRMIGRQLLENVTRYQFDDSHRLRAAYYAKSMTLDGNQWIMHDVRRTLFFPERTKSQFFQALPLELQFNPNLLTMSLTLPKEMSLPKLVKFAKYLKQNGLQANQYEFEFWQRIFQPIASIIMIFLAIPFVLGTFTASTLGWRLMVGVLIGFCFFIINSLLGQLCIVLQLPAIFAALCPIFIFGLSAYVLSKKMIKQ